MRGHDINKARVDQSVTDGDDDGDMIDVNNHVGAGVDVDININIDVCGDNDRRGGTRRIVYSF